MGAGKTVEGNKELKMSWWRTCAKLVPLYSTDGNYETDEMEEENQFYLQIDMPTIWYFSAEENAVKLIRFRTCFRIQLHRSVMSYSRKRNERTYVNCLIESICSLDAWVSPVMDRRLERKGMENKNSKRMAT